MIGAPLGPGLRAEVGRTLSGRVVLRHGVAIRFAPLSRVFLTWVGDPGSKENSSGSLAGASSLGEFQPEQPPECLLHDVGVIGDLIVRY